jgi:hypothetical protein
MPISDDHLVAISQFFMKHSPQYQVVHANANQFQDQWIAACENWAIRGLEGNNKTPVDVLTTILMGTEAGGAREISSKIHDALFDRGYLRVLPYL